ncbi:Fungal transcriptional regulatory protein, N-terminal [Ilyonectria robusta]
MSVRPSRQRGMRFTGCWTCKARKVRCDERPLACGNCEKRGISCGGYDIRLQWMSDPFAQPSTPAASSSQGRRRIMLDKSSGRRFRMQEINEFLSTIDKDAESMLSSRKGPFSTFPTKPGCQDVTETSQTPHQKHTSVSNRSVESPHDWECDEVDLDHHTPGMQLQALSPNSALPLIINTPDWSAITSQDFDSAVIQPNNTADVEGCADRPNTSPIAASDNDNLTESSPSVSYGYNARDHSMAVLPMSPSPLPESISLPIQHIRSSLFGDTEADLLMHHYMIHVADVLQPILHTQNPYRRIYVPTALEGACIRASDHKMTNAKPHSALYHALLASAAYHLWNCDKAQRKYQEMGAEHRYRALHSLQAAVNSPTPGSDHQILLMAMLSLVSIGVMSGDGGDIMVHLGGIKQLRDSRRRWRIVSGETRQLNQISAFLALMARTTCFVISPSPWIGNYHELSYTEDAVIKSGSCFEFMYGITSNTAAAIQETCRLAEFLAQFDNQEEASIPDDLLAACEGLGDRLLSWTLESEKMASIPASDGVMLTIFKHQASAWHYAALVYYYRRIQRYDTSDLVREIKLVTDHAHAAEDAKVTLKSNSTNIMAPITWPVFIASLNAAESQRDACRAWWERIQHYGIANIQTQWDMVQRAWEREDEMQQKGFGTRDWTAVLGDLGTHIFPV